MSKYQIDGTFTTSPKFLQRKSQSIFWGQIRIDIYTNWWGL